MEKISISVDRELNLLTQYGLTAEEWWIIKLLFLASYPESRVQPLEEYSKIVGGLKLDIIESLQAKGILKKFKVKKTDHLDIDDIQFNFVKGEDGKSYPDIPFTANFIKSFLKHSGELGKELFLTYPEFINVNGSFIGARSITTGNHFGSMDDFFFFYGKSIKWNPEAHAEVIRLVNYAKENNLINCSLATFVINQRWREIQAAIKQGIGTYQSSILL